MEKSPDHRPPFVALCVCAAAFYGIIHDEITAHVAPEYFTIAHPALIPTKSPLWLGLFWGFVATAPLAWLLGWILGEIAYSPNLRAEPARSLQKKLAGILATMAASASIAGFSAWILASRLGAPLPEALSDAVPPAHHAAFLAVWSAHIASYASCLIAFSILAGRLWIRRGRPRILPLWPATRAEKIRFALLVLAAVGILLWRRAS